MTHQRQSDGVLTCVLSSQTIEGRHVGRKWTDGRVAGHPTTKRRDRIAGETFRHNNLPLSRVSKQREPNQCSFIYEQKLVSLLTNEIHQLNYRNVIFRVKDPRIQ